MHVCKCKHARDPTTDIRILHTTNIYVYDFCIQINLEICQSVPNDCWKKLQNTLRVHVFAASSMVGETLENRSALQPTIQRRDWAGKAPWSWKSSSDANDMCWRRKSHFATRPLRHYYTRTLNSPSKPIRPTGEKRLQLPAGFSSYANISGQTCTKKNSTKSVPVLECGNMSPFPQQFESSTLWSAYLPRLESPVCRADCMAHFMGKQIFPLL